MNLTDFNRHCRTYRAAEKVVQWSGAHVWKVGGKVFAIGGWSDSENLAVTFKADPETYSALKNEPGCRPAPYLASRGMKWIQWTGPESVGETDLKRLIKRSYELVTAGLSRHLRDSLKLEP
jgi:predicted DNA-binding protein (MmcQ/YjbR family)